MIENILRNHRQQQSQYNMNAETHMMFVYIDNKMYEGPTI